MFRLGANSAGEGKSGNFRLTTLNGRGRSDLNRQAVACASASWSHSFVVPFRGANQVKRCPIIDLNIHRIRIIQHEGGGETVKILREAA